MKREDTFALSPAAAKRVVVLFAAYGLLLIVAACYYYIISGDRRFPLSYLFELTVVCVCAWGINSRRVWALVLGGIFAAWQIYHGVSNMFVLLNAGGLHAPMSIQVIIWLLALRTVLLIVLLSLLLFYAGRGRSDNR
jgi:hypothetical protein